jgi:hypothetical protein
MQKKTLAICMIIAALGLVAACKKNSSPAPAGNVQHAITDTFYWRAKLDTTWVYHGDNNKSECNASSIGVCSSFLYDATFTLNDSANPHPHDSIIKSWLGKTFVTRGDTVSHAYTFTFAYPDSLSRTVSSENTYNAGSTLTITSIVANGVSSLTVPDSPGHTYNLYKIKGVFNVNLSRYNDTNVVHLTQGDFSTSVMESTKP